MRIPLSKLAQEALDVQDACNLSGVVHAFARAMSALCDHDLGTQSRNTHPIAIVWADKVAHLTGTQSLGNEAVMQAFKEVHALAAAPTYLLLLDYCAPDNEFYKLAMRVNLSGNKDLLDALDHLAQTYFDELADDGTFCRGQLSSEAITAAENAVRELARGGD